MSVFRLYPAQSVIVFLWIALVCGVSPAYAQRVLDANFNTIRAILELPEQKIDLAKAKLAIDRMVDPSIDTGRTQKQIDELAKALKAKVGTSTSSQEKLETLKAFIYQSGPWNDNRPFSYDLADPLGRNLRNKLLITYLETRKGNCVSMPILFVILGQKIGLDVTLATAPEHLFVKYRDDAGNLYNLETTSGAGFAREAWIRQQLPMTDLALANGVYMQPLSKKQTVVIMASLLNEFYDEKGLDQQLIALSELELKYYPKYVNAMLNMSHAYWKIRRREFVSKYPDPNDIPVKERPYFKSIQALMTFWREEAQDLGWRLPPDAQYSTSSR